MSRLLMAALAAALAACVGLGGVAWWKHTALSSAKAEINGLNFALAGCRARQMNIDKDRESDAEIDNMPDLRDIPDHWMFEPGTGGVY